MTVPTFDEMSDRLSRAMTLFLRGEGNKLLWALQIPDPGARQKILNQILAQTQSDPEIAQMVKQKARRAQSPAGMWDAVWLARNAGQIAGLADALPFITLEDPVVQRQVLRRIIQDFEETQPAIDHVLSVALENPDWEVRATAMLATVRLNATHLMLQVAQLSFPRSDREILGRADQQLMRELQVVALELLQGARVPEDLPYPPTTSKPAMHAHFLRCAAGEPTQWPSRVFQWCHALTHPVPVAVPPQLDILPSGISVKEGRYYLARTRLELVWIPPLPHWIGADVLPQEIVKWQLLSNPPRLITPESGYFVSRWPLTASLVNEILAAEQPALADPAHPYALCTHVRAKQICTQLAEIENLPISLPTAEAWEMAARGPDGRRYPWGNAVVDQQSLRALSSPWGCGDALGVVGQWTGSRDLQSGRPVVCGTVEQPHCAYRRAVAAEGLYSVRPLISLY